MGLETFEPETHEIKFKSGKQTHAFTVRGLTLIDISGLVGDHIADIDAAYELYKSAEAKIFSRATLDDLVLAMCRDVPGLVAEVISRTADEPHLAATYAKLPFSVSAVALAEILRMTLEEQGGLKNLSAALVTILKDVLPEKVWNVLEPQIQRAQPSDVSTGGSERT